MICLVVVFAELGRWSGSGHQECGPKRLPGVGPFHQRRIAPGLSINQIDTHRKY